MDKDSYTKPPPRYRRPIYTSRTPDGHAVFDRLEVSDDGKAWRTATEEDKKAMGIADLEVEQ